MSESKENPIVKAEVLVTDLTIMHWLRMATHFAVRLTHANGDKYVVERLQEGLVSDHESESECKKDHPVGRTWEGRCPADHILRYLEDQQRLDYHLVSCNCKHASYHIYQLLEHQVWDEDRWETFQHFCEEVEKASA